MARKPVYKYKNPKAPQDEGGEKKPFVVSPKAIIAGEDPEGVVRQINGSDINEDRRVIMLTESMAKFHGNLGQIIVELDFGADKDRENAQLREDLATLSNVEAENAELRQRLAALEAELKGSPDVSSEGSDSDDAALSALISSGTGVQIEPDGDETEAGDTADSSGGKPSNGHSEPAGDEAPKPSRRARRKTL